MSEFIWAQKGKLKKKFDRRAWEMLKDTNGWVEVDDAKSEIITPIIVKAPPASGTAIVEKKQIIQSEVKKEVLPEQVIYDISKKEITEEPEIAEKTIPNSSAQNDFNEFVDKNFTASKMKDYFDEKEIDYKNSMPKSELIGILSSKFNGDIEAVKAEFKITTTINAEL